MKLRANAVKLVFDVNNACVVLGEPFPNRLCRRLGSGEHAFDRPKDGQLRAIELFVRRQERGRSDVPEQHVGFFDLFEWNLEPARDGFFHQTFAETDPQVAG